MIIPVYPRVLIMDASRGFVMTTLIVRIPVEVRSFLINGAGADVTSLRARFMKLGDKYLI